MLKKFKCLFIGLLLSVGILAGCKNFISSNQFLEELENAVAYSNLPYSTVTILADLDYTKSILPAVGQYSDQYKVTDKISLSFTEKASYKFLNWSVSPEDAVEFVDCEKTENEAVIKILQTTEITIQPICVEKNTLQITLKSDNAIVTPAEQKAYLDDTVTIDCREDIDYFFLGWQVFDSLGTKLDDYSDIIDIEDSKSPNTKVTVKQTDTAITMEPLLIKRPKVVSAAPAYTPSGVLRDSKILIMFDEEMSETSIYYTEEEIKELTEKGYTLLTDASRNNNCYGYKDSSNNIFYKNISITNFLDHSVNYLKFYGAPYFDPNYPQVLRIGANRQSLPPATTDIMVTLSKNMGFTDASSSAHIPLNADYSFSYRTNTSIDNLIPMLGKYDENETEFAIRIIPETAAPQTTVYQNTWTALQYESTFSAENISSHNATGLKLWVRGKFIDDESGVSHVDWALTKLIVNQDSTYSENTELKLPSGSLQTYDEVSGTEVFINKVLDLSNLNLTEGIYKLTLKIYDYCDNVTTKDFQFIYDIKNPVVNLCTTTTRTKIRISLPPDADDIYKIDITPAGGAKTTYYSYDLKDSPIELANKTLSVQVYDYSGKSSEITTVTDTLGTSNYYYSDNTFSKNLYTYKTPAGIVYDVSSNAVQILDVNLTGPGYTLKKGDNTQFQTGNLERNGNFNTYDSNSLFAGQKDYSDTIWYYIKNSKNQNSSIQWYVPSSQNDYNSVITNKGKITQNLNKLSEAGFQCVDLTKNCNIITSTIMYSGKEFVYYNNTLLNSDSKEKRGTSNTKNYYYWLMAYVTVD